MAEESKGFRPVRSPFEGALVRLRAIEEQDLPAIHDLFNEPAVLQYLSSVTFPQPEAGTRAWWETARASGDDHQHFAIETRAGELIGVCGLEELSARCRTAVLGLWIGEPHWDRGYGTDAVRTVCRFGFQEMNLRRISLHVLATNPRGRRAYDKVGFREEGVLRGDGFVGGRPVDVTVMALGPEDLTADG